MIKATKLSGHTLIRNVLKVFLITAFIWSGTLFSLNAEEPQVLRRSIRALGMGNAFIAVSNDENALLYNPAGLNKIQHWSVEALALNGTFSQNIIDLAGSNDFQTALNEIPGKVIHMDGSLGLPRFTTTGFGIGLISGAVLDGAVHNPVVPYISTTFYIQYGLIGGFALDFMDEQLDIGTAIKYVARNGIKKDFHIVDLADLDQLVDDLQDDLETKSALAPDIGVLYTFDQYYNLEPKVGFVLRNFGGMDFGATGSMPMSMDLGVSTESELAGFDITLAADFVDFTYATTEYKSFQRNLKMGMEIGVMKRSNNHHMLSFRLGRNGPYSTFGLTVNPPWFPAMFEYANWSEEVGDVAGSIEDKRHSFQLSFNF